METFKDESSDSEAYSEETANVGSWVQTDIEIERSFKTLLAYHDHHFATIRYANCLFELSEPNRRCEHCKKFRGNVLRSGLSRLLRKEDEENGSTRTDSHTNALYLITKGRKNEEYAKGYPLQG